MPLSEWLDGLRDGRARARVVARIDRLSVGLLGDWKSVAEDGKVIDGEMEAADAKSVIARLRAAGRLPISAEPKTARYVTRPFSAGWRERRMRIRTRDLTAVTATSVLRHIRYSGGIDRNERCAGHC